MEYNIKKRKSQGFFKVTFLLLVINCFITLLKCCPPQALTTHVHNILCVELFLYLLFILFYVFNPSINIQTQVRRGKGLERTEEPYGPVHPILDVDYIVKKERKRN